ncbi:carboxymuconolactone decarboxylase family protein [Phyllobacterium salinisoli]|uniref:Carboxymuconolactone decarboxylase family protein n=1 Tax=Phyllobacterium salinisoli TaxID=1899321 RepID=A0A368K7M2_9HYPH|nr:carboxymuconolactone decarboxylase family protein [Phyllobacterium salinisoli]RCS25349.1 carboxymuconolactone decarboxylase family protein [Phyllobacterium salinisoli]
MGSRFQISHPTVAIALLLGALSGPVLAQTTEERLKRGDTVIRGLNNGVPQSTLEGMRQEFPFLADATEAYALGDVWSRPGLDNRTRQLAAVAVFAAMGEPAFMKIHAGYALNIGVSEDELKEVIYMVTVPAGFPRAITASQTLSKLFAERRRAAPGQQQP